MEALTKPRRVRPGDTVAVVSPSFGAVGRWPHRVERATAYLESLGLKVRLMPNADRTEGWASAPPEDRVTDLHAAFAEDDVAVVLCGIGGNHSNQLLPVLDYDLIRAHPEVFQGYSDITLDWNTKLDLTRPRELHENEGWVTIREGVASGPLLGGCLETICWHVKGSEAWLEPDGAILLLETSEEAPSPAHVDAYLTDLEQLGVFDVAAGLLVARPMRYSDDDRRLLWEVVERRTAAAGIPVLGNVEAGHADPMVTMPFGRTAEVDAGGKTLRLLEAPTGPA